MKFPESPFWNYSSQLFQIAEVAEACLAMQNNFDADVNLLLFCCWAGDHHRQLNDTDINNLINSTAPWQNAIIKPLREARKLMKSHIIGMPATVRYGKVDGTACASFVRHRRVIVPRRPHGASGIRAATIPLDRPPGLR